MHIRVSSNICMAIVMIYAHGARAETLLETVQRLSATVEQLKSQCAPQNNVTFTPGQVRLWGKASKEVAIIGDTVEHMGGEAWFYSTDGKLESTMGVSTTGGGFARFYNRDGTEVVYIGSLTNGKGTVEVNGNRLADFSEVFELARRDGVIPGTVMSADGRGMLGPSRRSYDPGVVGVVSGAGDLQPGMRIGSREDGSKDLPVALIGQVYVRVSSENGGDPARRLTGLLKQARSSYASIRPGPDFGDRDRQSSRILRGVRGQRRADSDAGDEPVSILQHFGALGSKGKPGPLHHSPR